MILWDQIRFDGAGARDMEEICISSVCNAGNYLICPMQKRIILKKRGYSNPRDVGNADSQTEFEKMMRSLREDGRNGS